MATTSKTTASYKMPAVSSSYHEKCIAASVKAIREASEKSGSGKTFTYGDFQKCNAVAQEKIWSEHCRKEHNIANSWKRDWQFLTEYDYKGNPRQKKVLSAKRTSFYGQQNVPLTTSEQIGRTMLQTNSLEIGRLERSVSYRKSRTDVAQFGSQ